MIHGGDIYRNKVNLDFSVNISPMGLSERVKQALVSAIGDCENYPDLEAEQLRQVMGQRLGVTPEEILCGNGASELFLAAIHGLQPKKTVIPVPSFFGYEKVAVASGGSISFYQMKKDHGFCLEEGIFQELTEDTDLLFLANPNNPVGNLLSPSLLERILLHCKRNHIWVILDECFMELTDHPKEHSCLHRIKKFENLIVIRAFTKSFAMPGVRLGYLGCSNKILLEKIKHQLPEWNLSAFAQAAGMAAMSETEYLEKGRKLVQEERKFLKEELEQLGISVYPGGANFLLLETELPLYESLLKQHILIRDCRNFRGLGQGFYRIAVKRREENRKLLEAIKRMGGLK